MVELIIDIAREAGKAILEVYNNPEESGKVEYKEDKSPLTKADEMSHKVITQKLAQISPLPILSEESENIDYSIRQSWQKYWLVDPLDGTKEFINRNGEFTVNISLIENNKPVLGVIHVPVTEITYYGESNSGAYIKKESEPPRPLKVNNRTHNLTAVRSKSHASEAEEGVLSRYDVVDSISVGSSLKFCMVAEGKADVYYRHGPTMEWDIAAGHAILMAAGGNVYRGSEKSEPFTYNKEDLLNGSFLALGF